MFYQYTKLVHNWKVYVWTLHEIGHGSIIIISYADILNDPTILSIITLNTHFSRTFDADNHQSKQLIYSESKYGQHSISASFSRWLSKFWIIKIRPK